MIPWSVDELDDLQSNLKTQNEKESNTKLAELIYVDMSFKLSNKGKVPILNSSEHLNLS